MDQILAKKELDNIVRERHVYSGPKGDGYIDYEYRMNNGKLEVKATHNGPELRNLKTDWTVIENSTIEEQVQISTESKVIDEVDSQKIIEKVERKIVDIPVYETRQKIVKNKIEEDFFTVKERIVESIK